MKIFLTAAVGRSTLLGPARRLVNQMESLRVFDKHIIVTDQDLSSICPHLHEWYSAEQLNTSKGYGYYVWKSAIAEAAMNGYWGNANLVLYLDAGCEVLPGQRTRTIINGIIDKAEKNGAVCFKAGGPEWQYSKPELFALYPDQTTHKYSPQLQAGTWVLSGPIGFKIAKEWNRISSLSPSMTNDVSDFFPPGFIATRHDQSVFSLVVKNFGITPETRYMPFPRRTFFSQLKALAFPVWASRNLASKSIVKPLIRIFARLLR